jgi:hypothetical protein
MTACVSRSSSLGGKLPQVLELVERAAEFESAAERVSRRSAARARRCARHASRSRPQAYVLSANALYTVVRTLAIPFRGARRVAAAVPFELEPYLAFPLEDLAVDFTTVGEFDGETEVLAMGMRRQQLDEQLDILREAGIDTDAVTLDALALTGLWITGRDARQGPRGRAARPRRGLRARRAEQQACGLLSRARLQRRNARGEPRRRPRAR